MGFQTESRALTNKVNTVQNKQVEAFDRIERLEELARSLTERIRKLEEGLARLEKAFPRKSAL